MKKNVLPQMATLSFGEETEVMNATDNLFLLHY